MGRNATPVRALESFRIDLTQRIMRLNTNQTRLDEYSDPSATGLGVAEKIEAARLPAKRSSYTTYHSMNFPTLIATSNGLARTGLESLPQAAAGASAQRTASTRVDEPLRQAHLEYESTAHCSEVDPSKQRSSVAIRGFVPWRMTVIATWERSLRRAPGAGLWTGSRTTPPHKHVKPVLRFHARLDGNTPEDEVMLT